ncbi:MAG: peptidase S10, partial [Alphaproteobacteria bacterium]
MSETTTTEPKPTETAAPVITEHEISVNGARLRYRVTTGMMPIKNGQTGEVEANIFFMAYNVLEGGKLRNGKRPLMFSFNGGPGSASVWLHLGALGPKRIAMEGEKGDMPAPPYHVEDNPNTWLPDTDLVFIDPVGTGYSRPTKQELGKKFWSVQGDVESIGEFIRMYLSRYERWSSPLFLVGESYGTTRSAGIAGYLIDKGIAFNGIVLVSSVMQFQTLDFDRGNDLPYSLFLPTYTATAFYHKKLAPELSTDLAATLKEAEAFAEGEYTTALAKGDRLSEAERKSVAAKLSRLTGISEAYI